MGRKRTRLELSAADRVAIDRHLNATRDLRKRERLGFALKAATGRHTLEELALASGRSRSTLQNWLEKFAVGGLSGLLARDAAPGKRSPLAGKRLQLELRQRIKARPCTAQEISDWLRERHGIELARKSVYYWLRKIAKHVG